MFDHAFPFRLAQIKKNKYFLVESYLREYIYVFHSKNNISCIKYIVSIKEYPGEYLKVDFYPKLAITGRINEKAVDVREIRFRMLTNQNLFSKIAATVMDIMVDVQKLSNCFTWGMIASSLAGETDSNNKRFRRYVRILKRNFFLTQKVYEDVPNSSIFVIPLVRTNNLKEIVEDYGEIFAETF